MLEHVNTERGRDGKRRAVSHDRASGRPSAGPTPYGKQPFFAGTFPGPFQSFLGFYPFSFWDAFSPGLREASPEGTGCGSAGARGMISGPVVQWQLGLRLAAQWRSAFQKCGIPRGTGQERRGTGPRRSWGRHRSVTLKIIGKPAGSADFCRPSARVTEFCRPSAKSELLPFVGPILKLFVGFDFLAF